MIKTWDKNKTHRYKNKESHRINYNGKRPANFSHIVYVLPAHSNVPNAISLTGEECAERGSKKDREEVEIETAATSQTQKTALCSFHKTLDISNAIQPESTQRVHTRSNTGLAHFTNDINIMAIQYSSTDF